MEAVRSVVVVGAVLAVLTASALLMTVVMLLTLWQGRRLCAEVIAPPTTRACLGLMGVRLDIHYEAPTPDVQAVYVVNHTSTLDLFIVMSMGLPRTRFFLKRRFLVLFPIGLIALLLGTFFTPPQTDRRKRVACFSRAERTLRRTGDSVFLSPEGTRITTGGIGPFNKGAFHLATNLKAPIVPLFIEIPPEINPGRGVLTRPGTVSVTVKPAISTADWHLDDLEENRDAVRARFVGYQEGRTGVFSE